MRIGAVRTPDLVPSDLLTSRLSARLPPAAIGVIKKETTLMSLLSGRRASSSFLVLALIGLFWFIGPNLPFGSDERHIPLAFSEEELRSLLGNLRLKDEPAFSASERRAANLGRQLFSDARFSDSGEIACASCHQPGRDFTDGRPLAIGIAPTRRHTPSLVNSFAAHWFFWDGRADSLTAQVQGPLEAVLEHGFDRGRSAQTLFRYYRSAYEDLFGPFPSSLLEQLKQSEAFRAQPLAKAFELPLSIAHYALATIGDGSLQVNWIQAGADARQAPQRHLARAYWPNPAETPATRAFAALSEQQQKDLNGIFARYSWALAQYERGLIARRSPFDRFIERWQELPASTPAEKAFGEGFRSQHWRGFRTFMESGCASCHSGPTFSDQEFHNIGLPQHGSQLDLGRVAGIQALKADLMNCEGLPALLSLPFPSNEQRISDSCSELPYIRTDLQEMVGAFKTPTLRNVANTPPYMHDGRFAELSDVLAYYNRLDEEPAVGHREESLKPLRLEAEQLEDLEAFLRSLSAPVEDLSALNDKK